MANIKSIGGNPIVLGLDGLTDEAKASLGSGAKLSAAAESLLGTPDTAQWAQRVTTGSGAAIVRSVQGAAVAWNQLATSAGSSATTGGVTFTNNGDGSWTVSGTADAGGVFIRANGNTPTTLTPNHVYLITGCPDVASPSTCNLNFGATGYAYAGGAIWTNPRFTDVYLRIEVNGGVTLDNAVFRPQIFDLTTMFGAGNEPATVAEFEKMFPETYYPYSAPTLKPVQIAGIASTDANGAALDSVEWTAQTLRAAGSVADELTADELVTRVGVVDLGTLNWAYTNNRISTIDLTDMAKPATTMPNIFCEKYEVVPNSASLADHPNALTVLNTGRIMMYAADASTPSPTGLMFYELATSTTQAISPALHMTYRVERGGTEAIIVPTGEISAAPVLTVAEGESAADVVMDALECIAAPDGPAATANHAVNTYLTMGGKLYKVTSAIAVGETIAPNTNVTETTVMAELIARTA